METKNVVVSKTIWLNVIMGIIVAVLPVVPGAEAIKLFVESNIAMIGMVWSVLGIIVRLVTKSKVTLVD